ncbi:hypothetical protein BH11PSE8_BH11PSE8_23970 [soil metagenome]
MRASGNLTKLRTAVVSRIRLLRFLHKEMAQLSLRQQSIQLAFIAIELDNLIIRAFRAFTISTLREAKTTGGLRISVAKRLDAEDEIAAYVLSVLNVVKFKKLKSPSRIPRTDESAIRDPKQIEKIFLDCNASNLTSLQNALSLNSRVFRDVKFVRHFYAHRGQDTLEKALNNAKSMGVLNIGHPDDILRFVVNGRPFSVLEEWLIDAQLFFELLME